MFRIILIVPTLFLNVFVFSQKKPNKKSIEKSEAILKLEMQKNMDVLVVQNSDDDAKSTTTFIASAFKNLSLQSFIDSVNYIQSFTLDLGKEIKPATSLKINGIVLETGSDYWPFSFCPNTFFAGTSVWNEMQTNQPYLYDLKLFVEKNKNITKKKLIQHIKEKANELAEKKITALLVYNSGEINDNLEFAATDTTNLTPIPVIYFTKAGIKKLKTESTIAIAVDAHIVLGEKIFKGKNAVAFLNNHAANTVIVAAQNNNLTSAVLMLQLAKLLKETCQPNKKNSNGLAATSYMNNNYLFTSFNDIDSNCFGSNYFIQHLSSIEKTNYAIHINIICGTTDTTNFLRIDGFNSSSAWSSTLQSFDASYKLKIDSSVIYNLNNAAFYKANIPALYLFNSATELPVKKKPIINANDINAINYIMQLIASANNKGKLPFNK